MAWRQILLRSLLCQRAHSVPDCTCRKPSAEIFTAAKCCRTCVRPVPAACGALRRGATSPAALPNVAPVARQGHADVCRTWHLLRY